MQTMVEKVNRNRLWHKRMTSAVCILSLMVVVGVFWWLKLTGITMANEAFCGLDEHAHTEACGTECTAEAHTHTAACYSDISADLETSADWEKTLEEVPLTGAWGVDLAAIAESQLGYAESEKNYQVGEDLEKRGYTRYGDWYGNPYGEWSAMFTAFCLHYAGIPKEAAPYNSGAEAIRVQWSDADLLVSPVDMTPGVGDLLFLDENDDGAADSVGIVSKAEETTLTVIMGDRNDRVEKATWKSTDAAILSCGSLLRVTEKGATETERKRVDKVIERIAALPTSEEVEAQLEALSPEDTAAYKAIALDILTVYAYYEDLGPRLYPLVTNRERLYDLEWLWGRDMLATVSPSDTAMVYQVNAYSKADTVIVYGGSVKAKLGAGMGFNYWDAVVVEENASGLYVAQYVTNTEAKENYAASTANGFVLLLYQNPLNISVGDSVTVGSFYKTTAAYNANGLGTVTFGKNAQKKPAYNNSSKLDIVPGADTRELIEVNLFNYGANINTPYIQNSKYPGFQQDGGTRLTLGTSIGPYDINFGNNITSDLAASLQVNTGLTDFQGITNNGGLINTTTNKTNRPITGAMSPVLVDGFPALTEDAISLRYLFEDGTYATKLNKQSINGLFQYDPLTGAYYFNSLDNHAQFNADDDTFVLYDQIISSNGVMYPFGNFLPFNDIRTQASHANTTFNAQWCHYMSASARYKYNIGAGDAYKILNNRLDEFINLMNGIATGWGYEDALQVYFNANSTDYAAFDTSHLDKIYAIDYDEPTDFFFGMDMHMEFIQPKDGLTGKDGKQPMVYEFTGDDDVLVYIDGKLFLDLSGIHRHVGGKIDFVEGKVYYYELQPLVGTIGEIAQEPYQVVDFRDILGNETGLNAKGAFEDYSKHTFDFYYMERGAGSSVCRMNFNFPVLQKNHIAVTKELTADGDIEAIGDPDFCFQVYKENGTELLIGADTAFTIHDTNGNKIGDGVTDANGVFTIKAGQMAVFGNIPENAGSYFVRELLDETVFAQYGTVTVDGKSTTSDSYTDVVIGTDHFKGVDSPVKDMSDGSTSFTFSNHVDMYEYGQLDITKELNEYDAAVGDKAFTFSLQLGGTPIHAGTPYLLIDKDGTTTEKTIENAGELIFLSGQTVRFPKVLAGTVVTLQESAESAAGYNVAYTVTGMEANTVDDESLGTYIIGTVGASSTVKITVENDKEGTKLPINGVKHLLYPDGASHTYTFVLRQITSLADHSFVEGGQYVKTTAVLSGGSKEFTFLLNFSSGTEAGTRYYLIYEEGAAETNGGDTTRYIVVVTTGVDGGSVTAAVDRIYTVGADGSLTETDSPVFTNKVVRSLTISKKIERSTEYERLFTFEITASVGGTPLEGAFVCADGSEVTFQDGKAQVQLKHDQTITICGLPYGTLWTVTEKNAESFFTQYVIDSGESTIAHSAEGTLAENTTVAFTNIGGYELPATGDRGIFVYILGGTLLVALSLIYGCVLRRKRERRATE